MKDSQKNQQEINRRIFLFFVLPLFFIFLFLFATNVKLNLIAISSGTNPLPLEFKSNPYPVILSPFSQDISAEGLAVLDEDSNVVFYSKNPTRYFSPASTTKILTALTALDVYSLDQILTVKEDNIEGSTIGLKSGDQLTFESLLYAMMLPSSNDATVAIAQNYSLGEKAFVDLMNQKAKTMGLFSTHLEDPVGLMDEKDFSTPLDMVHLGTLAMKNSEISKIVGTKNKTIQTLSGEKFELSNLNILLGIDGVNGIKTGYTQTSGEVLVTHRNISGKGQTIVVMQSGDRFGDTRKILDFLNKTLTYLEIRP